MRIKRAPDRATASQQDGQSRLLLLPAELRNYIYELAFASNDDNVRPQNIFAINPPSRALLASSRQIYNEARGFYHEAWQHYWATHHFTINVNELSYADQNRFQTFQKCGFLQPLQNLSISAIKTSDRFRSLTFEFENRRGGWRVTEAVQGMALQPKYLVVQPQASERYGPPPLTWTTSKREKMEWACDTFTAVEGMDQQILAAI